METLKQQEERTQRECAYRWDELVKRVGNPDNKDYEEIGRIAYQTLKSYSYEAKKRGMLD